MAKLYVIPTPIGNLEDITLRSLRVLKEVDFILAEDTRQSKKLLSRYEITTPLKSHHKFNEHKTTESVVSSIQSGQTVALISDAGTPGISDPGFYLVRACIEASIVVDCLPGAVALIPALVMSGFPSEEFVFCGFLPHKKGRQTKLKSLVEEKRTILFYESPHRIAKTIQQLGEHFGTDRRACICREMTKVYEECLRGTLEELAKLTQSKKLKGEIVLVVEGNK